MDSYISATAITPSDTANLGAASRGLLLSVAGNIKVTLFDGSVITLTVLNAGIIHRMSVVRVWATGTTATGVFTFN